MNLATDQLNTLQAPKNCDKFLSVRTQPSKSQNTISPLLLMIWIQVHYSTECQSVWAPEGLENVRNPLHLKQIMLWASIIIVLCKIETMCSDNSNRMEGSWVLFQSLKATVIMSLPPHKRFSVTHILVIIKLIDLLSFVGNNSS